MENKALQTIIHLHFWFMSKHRTISNPDTHVLESKIGDSHRTGMENSRTFWSHDIQTKTKNKPVLCHHIYSPHPSSRQGCPWVEMPAQSGKSFNSMTQLGHKTDVAATNERVQNKHKSKGAACSLLSCDSMFHLFVMTHPESIASNLHCEASGFCLGLHLSQGSSDLEVLHPGGRLCHMSFFFSVFLFWLQLLLLPNITYYIL